MEYFIYCIDNPKIHTTFYVGLTNNPPNRFIAHRSAPTSSRMRRRFRELEEQGIEPLFRVVYKLGNIPRKEAEQRESYEIQKALSEGIPLLNKEAFVGSKGTALLEVPEGLASYIEGIALRQNRDISEIMAECILDYMKKVSRLEAMA